MAHNVLVVGFDDRVFNFSVAKNVEATTLRAWLDQKLGEGQEYHLTSGGAPLRETDVILCEEEWGTTLIRAHPILCGGKGGFGALIRAVGSRANRGGNKEACRDLSGRRLRDVNAQKKVTKWLEDEPERKKKRQEEKKRRLVKKAPPKHFFDDQAYMDQLRSNDEDMDGALKQGLEASSLKRKQTVPDDTAGPSTAKKPKIWVGGGGEGDLSSSDADSDSEDGSGQYEGCKSESGGGKVDPALNSAGSSDEVAQSKLSDEDDVGSSSHSDGGAKRVEGDMTPANGGGDGETGEQSEYSPAEEVSQKEGEATEQVESQDKKEVTQEKPVSTEPAKNDGPLDLNDYGSAEELESAGAERLKSVLQSLGLKCGGTLQERAQRLFSTRGKALEELDPSLFAKAGKSRKRKNKAQ